MSPFRAHSSECPVPEISSSVLLVRPDRVQIIDSDFGYSSSMRPAAGKPRHPETAYGVTSSIYNSLRNDKPITPTKNST